MTLARESPRLGGEGASERRLGRVKRAFKLSFEARATQLLHIHHLYSRSGRTKALDWLTLIYTGAKSLPRLRQDAHQTDRHSRLQEVCDNLVLSRAITNMS